MNMNERCLGRAQAVRRRSAVAVAAAAAVVASAAVASAQVKKWDGLGTLPAAWTDADNWDPNGLPLAGESILFDNSLAVALPTQMTFSEASLNVQSFTWNSNDSSEVVTDTAGAGNSVLTLTGNGAGGAVISMGPAATTSTFRFVRTSITAGGTGTIALELAGAGTIHVDQAGAGLDINTNIRETAVTRIVKTGAGSLDLSGFTHTYTGGLQVMGGTVNITGTGNLGTTPAAANAVELDGGALRIAGAFNSTLLARGFTLGAGGGTINVTSAGVGTISGPFTGPGRLAKSGEGTLWVTSTGSNFTGGVLITNGTMRVGSAVQLGALPAEFVANYLEIGGGTLLMLGNMALGTTRGVQLNANNGTFDVGATNTPSILGVISGPGGLNKVGGGTLTLGGSNTFAGAVEVGAGMLVVGGGTSTLGSTTAGTTVAAGAALGFLNDVQHESPEAVTISGTGAAGAGAIENLGGTNRLAGTVTLAADSTVGVTAGALTLGGASGPFTLTAAGAGNLTLAHARTAGLTVNNPVVAIQAGRSTDNTSVVKTLSIAPTSQVDLADQDLIVDYDGTSTLAGVRAAIVTGYAAGAWTGPGIASSVAAANGVTALGYAEASDLFTTFPAAFSGQQVDDTAVLVRYTRQGDANLDGTTNIADFSSLAANFNLPGDWVDGDFNYDGAVGIADFSLLAANFNQSAPAAAGGRPGAVPEPAAAGLIAASAALLGRRGRRGQ